MLSCGFVVVVVWEEQASLLLLPPLRPRFHLHTAVLLSHTHSFNQSPRWVHTQLSRHFQLYHRNSHFWKHWRGLWTSHFSALNFLAFEQVKNKFSCCLEILHVKELLTKKSCQFLCCFIKIRLLGQTVYCIKCTLHIT